MMLKFGKFCLNQCRSGVWAVLWSQGQGLALGFEADVLAESFKTKTYNSAPLKLPWTIFVIDTRSVQLHRLLKKLFCINQWSTYSTPEATVIELVLSINSFRSFCIWFLPRDAMLAQYLLWPCICPSVCSSQVGVLAQWLNVCSPKQRHTKS